jgi:hypothetical protein
MLNKWRMTNSQIPKAGVLKVKAQLIEAIIEAIEREEITRCEIIAASVEMAEAEAEASRIDGEDEDEEQDSVSDDGSGFDEEMEF